jgi:hypothetical protein
VTDDLAFRAEAAAEYDSLLHMYHPISSHVDSIPQQDSAERAFNKLARTFAVQMEALTRYMANRLWERTCVRQDPAVGGPSAPGRFPGALDCLP